MVFWNLPLLLLQGHSLVQEFILMLSIMSGDGLKVGI